MKKIDVTYNADGYIADMTDNAVHFEQENDSLQINATITTDKKVRAYIKAPNNNSAVTDELTPADGVYSCTVDGDYMAKGTLYIGFELYDGAGYIERLEPLKIYIDSFVSLGAGSSDNVYVVTVSIGNVQTVESGESASVENVGTKKDMILDFKIPKGVQGLKGDKGEKGDKGDKGDTGPQGIQGEQGTQGIQGVPGNDGYTPKKGVDYFTEEDIKSLGIGDKADKTELPTKLSNLTDDITEQTYNNTSEKPQSGKAVAEAIAKLLGSAPENLDTLEELAKALNEDENFSATVLAEIANKVDKSDGKGLSTNDFTDKLKAKVENNTFDYYIDINTDENPLDYDDYTEEGLYLFRIYSYSDDAPASYYILTVTMYYYYGGEEAVQQYQQSLLSLFDGEFKYRWNIGENWTKISVSQKDLNNAVGDIETALDSITAMQNSLIGGDA